MKIKINSSYTQTIDIDENHPDFERQFQQDFEGDWNQVVDYSDCYGSRDDTFKWLTIGDKDMDNMEWEEIENEET